MCLNLRYDLKHTDDISEEMCSEFIPKWLAVLKRPGSLVSAQKSFGIPSNPSGWFFFKLWLDCCGWTGIYSLKS